MNAADLAQVGPGRKVRPLTSPRSGRFHGQSELLSVLGCVEPDPVGQLLGTGYLRFESPTGICGLAKPYGDRLDILAVHARKPGNGQFRAFIAACKSSFRTVCVWHDWNPIIGKALSKYGFTPERDLSEDGEVLEGWRWDADV